MRQDKLTTKFQQALADAQSIALANDNQIMEDIHLLSAFLRDEDGSTKSLLQRAGVSVQKLTQEVEDTIRRLPKVSGSAGDIQPGRDLINWLNLTEKEAMAHGDEYISVDMAMLALTQAQGEAARIAKDAQVKRLLIGHFSARYEDEKTLLEEAQAIFPDTLAADEGLKISL